jgi:hypothetical protein
MFMIKNHKGFSAVAVLLIFIIVGVIGGTGWYVWNSNKKTNSLLNSAVKSSDAGNSVLKQDSKVAGPQIPTNWQWFESADKSVKFAYPKTWGTLSVQSQKESEHNYDSKSFIQPLVITAKKDLLLQIPKAYADNTWYFWDLGKNILASAEDKKAPLNDPNGAYDKPIELGPSTKEATIIDSNGHAVYHVLGKGAMNCGSHHYFFDVKDKVVHLIAILCDRGGEWQPQAGQQYKDVVEEPIKDIYKYIQD